MLKYVRLRHRVALDIIVFGLDPLSHADIAAAHGADGYSPKSAGFVSFDADGTARTHGESTSLRLKPDPSDAPRITVAYRITGGNQRALAPAQAAPISQL